jgi:hypothetical protein
MEYLRPINPPRVAADTASTHESHRNENVFLGSRLATRSMAKRLAGCVYAANGKGAVGGGGRKQLGYIFVSVVLRARLRCRDWCRRSDMDDGEESVVSFNFESSSCHECELSIVASSSSPVSNDAIAETPPSRPHRRMLLRRWTIA